MKTTHHYVLNDETGARLCQDDRWRIFAPFGTDPGCVKVYRNRGAANRKADTINGTTRAIAYVLSLPVNQHMNADGCLWTEKEYNP